MVVPGIDLENPSDGDVKLVSVDLSAIESDLASCKKLYPKYQDTRRCAKLDVNSQAILGSFFHDLHCEAFPGLGPSMIGPVLLNLRSQLGQIVSPSLVALVDKILVMDSSWFLQLEIPVEERLLAVWNSPHKRHLVKIVDQLSTEEGEHTRLPEETAALSDEMVAWIAMRRDQIGRLPRSYFMRETQYINEINTILRHAMPTESIPTGRGYYERNTLLEHAIKKIERVRGSAQRYFPEFRRQLFLTHCGGVVMDGISLADFEGSLRDLAAVITATERSLQLIHESYSHLDEEPEAQLGQSQAALRKALDRVKLEYNSMAAEFEQLPLWLFFRGRQRSLPQVPLA